MKFTPLKYDKLWVNLFYHNSELLTHMIENNFGGKTEKNEIILFLLFKLNNSKVKLVEFKLGF